MSFATMLGIGGVSTHKFRQVSKMPRRRMGSFIKGRRRSSMIARFRNVKSGRRAY